MTPSISTAGPIRVHQDFTGDTHVVADIPAPPFRGAFRVLMATNKQVRVSLGTVEGRVPTCDGVSLDEKKLPLLSLDEGPNEELLSWVCLRVTVDLASGVMDPKNAEAAQIVHVSDYSLISQGGFCLDDGKGNGHFPLALLVWEDKERVRRIVQNTWFNRSHVFKPGEGSTRGWHFFPPVA